LHKQPRLEFQLDAVEDQPQADQVDQPNVHPPTQEQQIKQPQAVDVPEALATAEVSHKLALDQELECLEIMEISENKN